MLSRSPSLTVVDLVHCLRARGFAQHHRCLCQCSAKSGPRAKFGPRTDFSWPARPSPRIAKRWELKFVFVRSITSVLSRFCRNLLHFPHIVILSPRSSGKTKDNLCEAAKGFGGKMSFFKRHVTLIAPTFCISSSPGNSAAKTCACCYYAQPTLYTDRLQR